MTAEELLAPDWAGETVIIVAGGPSVAQQDLSLLRDHHVIAVNSSYERLPQCGLPSPHLPHIDILIFGDNRWWPIHRDRILTLDCPIITVAQTVRHPRVVTVRKNMPPGLSFNRDRLTTRRTTLSGAINAAAFKAPGGKIILLGADGKFGEDGTRNHHTAHPFRHRPDCWQRHRDELITLRAGLAGLGITVINASPGSALSDLWPVMTLQQALGKETLAA